MNLGQALLALVPQEVWPVLQLRVDLLQSLRIVPRQLDLFPQVLGRVRALNRFDVEEAFAYQQSAASPDDPTARALAIFFENSCIATVR